MKNALFLFFFTLLFFSCEQDDTWLDNQVEIGESQVSTTRGISDIPNVISQLAGIPVYIKSVYTKNI